jgi:hypothetical protein
MDTKQNGSVSAGAKWGGLALGIIPSLMLILSGVMKFIQPAGFEEGLAFMGYRAEQMYALGVVELLCVAVYWIPRTSVLGAILLTGYMGELLLHITVSAIFFSSRYFWEWLSGEVFIFVTRRSAN